MKADKLFTVKTAETTYQYLRGNWKAWELDPSFIVFENGVGELVILPLASIKVIYQS